MFIIAYIHQAIIAIAILGLPRFKPSSRRNRIFKRAAIKEKQRFQQRNRPKPFFRQDFIRGQETVSAQVLAGIDYRIKINFTFNYSLQRRFLTVRHNFSVNMSTAFEYTEIPAVF